MKHFLYTLLIFSLCFPMFVSCGSDDSAETTTIGKDSNMADSICLIAKKVSSCSKLYTAEVRMQKVVVAEDPLKIGGSIFGADFDINIPAGDRKIAIPMKATVKAYIDLSKISKDNVKIDGQDIIIELPDPGIELISTEINHDEVKKDVSFFRSNFSDEEITKFSKQGRSEIIKAIPKSGILDKAKSGAAAVIVPMLTQLGYKDKNIRVVFNESVSSDMIRFIENNLNLK